MSEYWKSTPKYWCKHCSTYVKDTPFERRTHESTGKHQGNLKRFLRDIQNNHERGEREKERAKAEVERLNKVVGSSTPTAAGSVSSKPATPPHPSSARKSTAGQLTAADQKRQWTQLAEMGLQVPDDYRGELAMPGDWKAVSDPQSANERAPSHSLSVGVRKRKLNEEEQEEVEAAEIPSVKSVWGKSLRHYPGQSNDDLDDLLSGNTLKKEKSDPGVKQESGVALDDALQLSNAGLTDQCLDPSAKLAEASSESIPLVKTELHTVESESEPKVAASTQTADLAVAPVFKKRRSKAPPT